MSGAEMTSSASTVTKAYACSHGGAFLFCAPINLDAEVRGIQLSITFAPSPTYLYFFPPYPLLHPFRWPLLPTIPFRFPFTTSTPRFGLFFFQFDDFVQCRIEFSFIAKSWSCSLISLLLSIINPLFPNFCLILLRFWNASMLFVVRLSPSLRYLYWFWSLHAN